MNGEKIWLSSPTMHGDELDLVREAFDRNWIAPVGFHIDAFEAELARYVGVSQSAVLSSGTAALHLAVKLAGVERGDVVLCSDLTFAATVNPVVYEGGVPVLIDSEGDTWNMDPRALETALKRYGSRARAVILVHLYGTPAKLDEICALCDRYGVPLIEDAAESLSATYRGRQTGSFGQYGVVSFNGNKIITASGGGALLSNDGAAVERARFWASQARDPAPWYQHSQIGYNYRLSNVLAGIGRGQLRHLEEHRAQKAAIYRRYREGLRDLPLRMNPYLPDTEPNFLLSCITVEDGSITPEDLRLALAAEGMEARPVWKPMHLQPVFSGCEFISGSGDLSGDLFARGLCLPSDIKMTEEQQERVMAVIRGCLGA